MHAAVDVGFGVFVTVFDIRHYIAGRQRCGGIVEIYQIPVSHLALQDGKPFSYFFYFKTHNTILVFK